MSYYIKTNWDAPKKMAKNTFMTQMSPKVSQQMKICNVQHHNKCFLKQKIAFYAQDLTLPSVI